MEGACRAHVLMLNTRYPPGLPAPEDQQKEADGPRHELDDIDDCRGAADPEEVERRAVAEPEMQQRGGEGALDEQADQSGELQALRPRPREASAAGSRPGRMHTSNPPREKTC